MGKKRRRQQMQKRAVRAVDRALAQSKELRQIFAGEGAEPLSDEVIAELVEKGWPEDDLRRMSAEGYMYSRSRQSLIGPPEGHGLLEGFGKEGR